MKIFFVMVIAVLWSCGSPRQQYIFDRYDYNSGRKDIPSLIQREDGWSESPLRLSSEQLVASAGDEPTVTATDTALSLSQKAETLPATDRRALRKVLKKEIREIVKSRRSHDEGARTHETKELDRDLKLSIIFGAVGFTLVVLGGINTIFWVLGIAGLVVGLVFFIKWIQTQ
jgi:hypothetical protein